MRVADIGENLKLVNNPADVAAVMDALNGNGPKFHGKGCGCKAVFVLATDGQYTHVYGVKTANPNRTEQVHVHREPDSRW